MDLNHDSTTDRYSATLNSALIYFRSLAQSTTGWKRLSTASVRSPSTPNLTSKTSSSASHGGSGDHSGPHSSNSSPASQRLKSLDPSAHLPGGAQPSSAALAAMDTLLPATIVSKRSVPGKSAEIVRATIILPGLDEQTDLEDWRAVLECTGARKIWDKMVESSTVMQTLDDNTCITKTIFKTTWPASPRDALLIETTLLDHNAVLHVATSIKPSHDDPIFLRPSPPYVRAYLPLVAWHIQLVPAEVDEVASFTSFNSLQASQNRRVMPRHSIRISFYYQIDMRGWAANSAVSIQSHVPSCIANIYRFLRSQGVPPHVSRHSNRIQLDLNEYDPATGIYELRYDVIPASTEDEEREINTISSALKTFDIEGNKASPKQSGSPVDHDDPSETRIPEDLVLSDDEDEEEAQAKASEADTGAYVDVELDGERWGLDSDIVVHIFMNDIEDEEFVQENVECLKYMDRNRYILRMRHEKLGTLHGAINVKLRVERIPHQRNHGSGSTSANHLRQNHSHSATAQLGADIASLTLSVNGKEMGILPLRRPSISSTMRRDSFLNNTSPSTDQQHAQEQLLEEIAEVSRHWRTESDHNDPNADRASVMSSPLLLMSSSMPVTMQNLARSNRSVMSNGTNTATPGSTNPGVVNQSYQYFNSLLNEPTTSWKVLPTLKGVYISKLDIQGHAPGIVKGEAIYSDYTIWDIKAALDCVSSRSIWDKLFDDAQYLAQVSPSTTMSHVKLKGFWPTSPRDIVALNTTFITPGKIHYFATSTDDTAQFPYIPPPASPFVRSDLVVSGWFLETVAPRSVKIVYIAQAVQSGWIVPGTAMSAMTTELPLCVGEVIKYLEQYGSPPSLISIRRGRVTDMSYDHERSSYRLEYLQDSNPIYSGKRQTQQQQQYSPQPFRPSSPIDRPRRSTVDYTGSDNMDSSVTQSPKLAPTDKLLAEIRIDARRWTKNGDCDIIIDPPPSHVTVSCLPHDATGYRVRVEHSSGRAVPAGGKVLLMAKKASKPGSGIVVNGVPIAMPAMAHLEAWTPAAPKPAQDRSLTLSAMDGALTAKELEGEDEDDDENDGAVNGASTSRGKADKESSSMSANSLVSKSDPSDTADPRRNASQSSNSSSASAALTPKLTPLQRAQQAMDLLQKINADPESSWTPVSSSKNGFTVSKRFLPGEVSDQVPIVRGDKVVEGASIEEIMAVITSLGARSKLDDLFDSGTMIDSFGAGCSTFHAVLKSYFPLPLPPRDLYYVCATASMEEKSRCPQVVMVSTSIPSDASIEALARSDTADTLKKEQARPIAHLYLSAWILETMDPYSTNHPIPSTRVTYMTALDLGGSVPQRISGMLQTMFPKAVTQLEAFIQMQANPPIIRIPAQMVFAPAGQERRLSMSTGQQSRQQRLRSTTRNPQSHDRHPSLQGDPEDETKADGSGGEFTDAELLLSKKERRKLNQSRDREVETYGGRELNVPSLIPWKMPSSRITASEYKLKDASFQLQMLFDHFQLERSRFDSMNRSKEKTTAQRASETVSLGSSGSRVLVNTLQEEDREGAGTVARIMDRDRLDGVENPILSSTERQQQQRKSMDIADSVGKSSAKPAERTVLELIVDLKQFPLGYNVTTNVKVDPEFLLQHKRLREQERDTLNKQSAAAMLSSVKKMSNAFPAATTVEEKNANISFVSPSLPEQQGTMPGGIRQEAQGQIPQPAVAASATAGSPLSAPALNTSAGAGIAAVLGRAEPPRSIPASASLLKILPPPLTIKIYEIPPAPSHSSSLSGVSKRRKHLLLITVPDPDATVKAHPQIPSQAQQQLEALNGTLNKDSTQRESGSSGLVTLSTSGSGIIRSTGTSKSSVLNSTKANMTNVLSPDSKSYSFTTSALDQTALDDATRTKTSLSDGTSRGASLPRAGSTNDVRGSRSPGFFPKPLKPGDTIPNLSLVGSAVEMLANSSTMEPEKRVFQLGVQLNRLELKDLDSAAHNIDKEWHGRVMVDGIPVEILNGLSRSDLGFMDGVAEQESDQTQGSLTLDLVNGNGHDNGTNGDVEHPSLRSRKKRHHQQQLQQQFQQNRENGEKGTREHTSEQELDRGEISDQGTIRPLVNRHSADNSSTSNTGKPLSLNGRSGSENSRYAKSTPTLLASPTTTVATGTSSSSVDRKPPSSKSSVSGFSAFLMNVGLMSDPSSASVGKYQSKSNVPRSSIDSLERTAYGSRGDELAKRAKGSTSRGKRVVRGDDGDHDLELESLHGGIVFQGHPGDDNDRESDWSGSEAHLNNDGEYGNGFAGDMKKARGGGSSSKNNSRQGTLTRRQGREATRQEHEEEARGRHSGRDGEDNYDDHDGHGDAASASRRRESRASYQNNRYRNSLSPPGATLSASRQSSHNRRFGSTNGADHPRFSGSSTYAYSFRKLIWISLACFFVGIVLRMIVIQSAMLGMRSTGVLYSNTLGSGFNDDGRWGDKKGRSAENNCYAIYKTCPSSTSPYSSLGDHQESGCQCVMGTGFGLSAGGRAKGKGSPGWLESVPIIGSVFESTDWTWPLGFKELMSIKGVFGGWDVVLVAIPSHQEQHKRGPQQEQGG